MKFYDFSKIFSLDLSHNDLTGRISEWIDRISNLRYMRCDYATIINANFNEK